MNRERVPIRLSVACGVPHGVMRRFHSCDPKLVSPVPGYGGGGLAPLLRCCATACVVLIRGLDKSETCPYSSRCVPRLVSWCDTAGSVLRSKISVPSSEIRWLGGWPLFCAAATLPPTRWLIKGPGEAGTCPHSARCGLRRASRCGAAVPLLRSKSSVPSPEMRCPAWRAVIFGGPCGEGMRFSADRTVRCAGGVRARRIKSKRCQTMKSKA